MNDLTGTPRPHYLVEVGKISPDGTEFLGQVNFPSTDPSVGDRIDHVNVAHHLFALWNASHLMCQRAGAHSPRAYETATKSRRPTTPNTPVSIEAKATIEKEDSKRIFGTISATFCEQRNGKTLCTVSAKFVAKRG